jgi:OOP family OmpA-OmpF porin
MVFLLGLFLLSPAVTVFAENQAGTFTLDPFTGLYQFDNAQQLDLRSYYGLRGGYNFTKHVGLEAMFGYVPTETQSQAVVDRDVRVWRYGLDALYNFNPNGTLVPFIEAGVGVTQTKNTSGGLPNHGRGMFDYGAGLKYFLSDTVALRGDVKQALFTEGGDSRTNMEYTVGLTFLLGAEKKTVAVAAIPPVADTTAPEVVCTSPDSGVTGVATDRNIRATFSEEMDRRTITTSTFTVKRGTTPVTGKVTFAGTTATFSPASELEKGTTYTATIAAGVKDPAGNALANSYAWSFTTVPAPKVAVVVPVAQVAPVVLIVLEDNHFEFDKSAITEQGAEILDENIKILKANPKVKIRIAGYTSAKGTEDYNQLLSERRAQAVKDYLVKGGIAADRLVTIGFGRTRPAEFEPIPDNIYSDEAKANMRVLFEVIMK